MPAFARFGHRSRAAVSAEQWSLGYPIPSVPLPHRFSAWGQLWPQEHLRFHQAMNPSPYKACAQWSKVLWKPLG